MNIEQGNMRFMVGFEDADLTIPIIQTIRFLYMEKSDRGEELMIFEEIHSMREPEKLFVRKIDFDDLVLDQERLLEVLRKSFDGSLAKYQAS